MKELRRRISKTYERHQKIFDAATLRLSHQEINVFLDAYFSLPGLMDYIDRKIEDYDEASGEPSNKFLDRHFFEYKAAFENKQKGK